MNRFVLHKAEDITKVGAYLRSLDYTKPMAVEIKRFRKNKTSEQRGWFHVLCGMMSNETGYSPAEIKELVKKVQLGTKTIMIGNVEKEVTESSEEQDRENYSLLIEALYRLAAEAGIVLPQPYYKVDE